MPYDVTSWFVEQTLLKVAEPIRKFTIGSSDYSCAVVRWPKFKKSWNDIRPTSFTISLVNDDQMFNFFRSDKTTLRQDCTLEIGYSHVDSDDELITLFSGKTDHVRFEGGKCNVTVTDKFKQLSDRVVGTSDEKVSYTGSNYLPADIAWWAITSYGGYDVTTSTANTDIDWDSWLAWSDQ